MAQEHSHIPVASSRASSIDMSPHNTHSRRLAPATQASSDSLTSHELTNLQPNPHTEALDSAISLLTGFTSQQLASISKLIHFTVKTALEERLDLTAPCADPAAVTDSMPGRRIAKVVSSVVKNALDELHNSSMTDDAPLSMALVACDQDVEPTQSAQTHLPQVPPSKSQAHSVSAESSQDVPPDSQHIQIRDFQSNEHQVKYRTDYPRLLVNAPRDHPRIIDISSVSDEISQRGLGFADLVVTILFMYDPRLLSDFLDLSKSHFDFRRISTSQSILVPFIERRIKFVTCGFLKEKGKTVNESITYRIINEGTGAWAPVSVQGPLCQTVIGPKRIDDHVRTSFAKTLLNDKIWEVKEGSKFIIKAR